MRLGVEADASRAAGNRLVRPDGEDITDDSGIVLWMDEELGQDEIAKRLLALGATPEEVEAKFLYYPFPGWQWTDSTSSPGGSAADVKPTFVVIDTVTDALSEAGLDEDRA